jgi:hypothetical protein
MHVRVGKICDCRMESGSRAGSAEFVRNLFVQIMMLFPVPLGSTPTLLFLGTILCSIFKHIEKESREFVVGN